jgi:phage-related baseplate assembly protein
MFEYDGHRLFSSNGRHIGRDIVERQPSNSTDIEGVTSIAVDAPTSLVVLKPLKENR